MTFIFSDKNRSINAFLNFLYFFVATYIIWIFSYSASIIPVTGGFYEFNYIKFQILMIIWCVFVYFPLIFKKFFILKIYSVLLIIITIFGIFDFFKIIFIYSFFSFDSYFSIFLFIFFSIFLFVMAWFKEKYFQKNSKQ